MNEFYIAAQACSIISLILTIISYQMKSPKMLLVVNFCATAAMTVSYLLLGAWSGMILNCLCLVRNLCFIYKDKEMFGKKPLSSSAVLPIIIVLMVGGALMSWDGPASLLIMVALALNTFFMSLDDNQKLRYSILLTSSLVIVYNVLVMNYAAILNEAFAIVSSVVGIVRFREKKA